MRNFIIGFILGMVLSAGLSFAAMSSSINDRKFDQYSETADGKVAVLITIAE